MVEVLWTARYDYEPGWTLSPHHHPFFQIIYCLGGRGTLMLTGHSHTLAPRTLFLIAPAHLHGLVAASAVKTLDIKFRVRDAQLRRALMRLPPVLRRADETAAHLLERIRHEGAYRQPFYCELCASSLVEMLIALYQSALCERPVARGVRFRQTCRRFRQRRGPHVGVTSPPLLHAVETRVPCREASP